MAPIIRICSAALALVAAPAAAATNDLAAYLRARVAAADGQGAVAVESYARALDAAPANPVVAIRAYREALAAGDAALARRAAAALAAAGVAPPDAALLPLADAARADDPAAAESALPALAAGRLAVLVPALRVWIAAARGAPSPPSAPDADAVSRRLAAEARALRRIASGEVAAGLAAVEPSGSTGFRIAAAELLTGTGHAADATRLLAQDPAALAAAQAGATAAATLRVGVSRLLLRLADDLGGGRATTLGLALARTALDADPGYVRARLVLADQLALADDTPRALAELAQVPADGPLGPAADARRVELLAGGVRSDEALATARALADAPRATAADRLRYADLLVAQGRAADALPLYARAVRERGTASDWQAWLRYGAALDTAGRWPVARRALRQAAALAPDRPTALNHLGYALVEHGEGEGEAIRLLERAHALDRDDPSIADSLGWAYHRAGQSERALPLLEAAAADAPASAEIAEHLGDAYWALGRRYEARYAWRAATVTADRDAATRLATKQDRGP